jgi:putative endonuclease
MGYFIYILYSPEFKRTYVGQTNNLQNRLSYHNAGKVRSTKAYAPWVMIHTESYNTRSDAMNREKWFKSSQGRKLLKRILEEYLVKQSGD